jgi:predicted ester cyclase
VAERDLVVSHGVGSGTFSGALMRTAVARAGVGQPVAFEEIRIDRHEYDRIVESWFIPDRLTLWQQMGLLPALS